MKKCLLAMVLGLTLIFGLYLPVAEAYTFVPTDPADTDSAVLVDNLKVVKNGNVINPNYNFESGDLTDFSAEGDVKVIDRLGSITPSDKSNYFALVNTGPGSRPNSWPYFLEGSHLWQEFYANPGDNVTVSFEFNFLTNETNFENPGNDGFYVSLFELTTNSWVFVGRITATSIKDAAFHPAPSDTGFSFQTGFQSIINFDLSSKLTDFINQGSSHFLVYLGVIEEYKLPFIELSLNQTSFVTGETLIVQARVTNGPLPIDTDAKLWVNINDPEAETIRLPILKISDFHLEPNTDFTAEIFRYTFNGSEASGSYDIGASFSDSIDGRWFNGDSKSFTFIP